MTFGRRYSDYPENLGTNSQWPWIKVLNVLWLQSPYYLFKNMYIMSDTCVYLMYRMKCIGKLGRWQKSEESLKLLASVYGSTQIQHLHPTPSPETAGSFQVCETHLIDIGDYMWGEI